MQNGVIYIAFGDHYVNEAIHSAASVKLHMPNLPITLFTDKAIEDPNLDVVTLVDPGHRRAKVDIISQSPYDKTLYLDSDTEVRMDFSDIFELLDRFDMAGAHDHNRKGVVRSARVPAYGAIPYAFSEINAGVLAFRKSPETDAFFETWRKHFYEYREATGGLDQPAFRTALWSSNLRFYVLPFEYNVRSKGVMRKLLRQAERASDEVLLRPRIFHWHGLNKKKLFYEWRKKRKALFF